MDITEIQPSAPLRAFHSDPAVKAKYLARVKGHIEADNLIRGEGWDGSKGCAVGCTLEAYDHSRYPIELGIPEWLARVEDTLFEGMSEEKSRTWPKLFLDAITPGADLERIKAPFMLMVLRSSLATQEGNTHFDAEANPKVAAAIEQTKDALKEVIAFWETHGAAYSAAYSADSADSAADSARSAAYSAARSAARSAAYSARSAAYSAARSAADSARSAAYSADSADSAAYSARSAAHDRFADGLLALLRECQPA